MLVPCYVEKNEEKNVYYMLKPRIIRKLCCVAETGLLHSGGSYCMVEARSAYQIWEARVCMAEADGVSGFPPSLNSIRLKKVLDVVFHSFKFYVYVYEG